MTSNDTICVTLSKHKALEIIAALTSQLAGTGCAASGVNIHSGTAPSMNIEFPVDNDVVHKRFVFIIE